MNEQLQAIIKRMKKYNGEKLATHTFGLSYDKHYDVLVVAPGWRPTKILADYNAEVITTAVHSYITGYEVKLGDKFIGWIQVSSGACNLIDHLMVCLDLNFDKLVFLGAVGGLKKGFNVGDICTPSYSVEGTMASAYLEKDIKSFCPFSKVFPSSPNFVDKVIKTVASASIEVKQASVFCTDSISCEYYHLDFIKSFDTDLIEMETSAFYRLAQLAEKPAIALLVVSDNSANDEPLILKSELQENKYNFSRKTAIPKLIEIIANL